MLDIVDVTFVELFSLTYVIHHFNTLYIYVCVPYIYTIYIYTLYIYTLYIHTIYYIYTLYIICIYRWY